MTKDDAERVRAADLTRAVAVRARTDAGPITTGGQVRLLNRRRKEYDWHPKAHEPVWSSEVFTVGARAGPNSYTIDTDGKEMPTWPVHSLQAVPSDTTTATDVRGPKVNRKVVAAQRAEYRNIDGEEQATSCPSTKHSVLITSRWPADADVR